MENIVRTEFLEKPEPILLLGNNNYYYNYDIKPCKIKVGQEDKEEKDGWSCIQVYITGIPEYNKTVKNVIRAFISLDEEFDLINTYNKSIILKDLKVDNSKYYNYLELVENIKKEIKLSFNE